MLQENIYKDWWGQQSAMKASNQQKIYTILLAYGEFENLCFISVAWTVSVLRAFVYTVVDEKQNLYRFLGKTTTVDKCSQFKGYSLDWPITGEHFKPNPSTVEKCKLKLWL